MSSTADDPRKEGTTSEQAESADDAVQQRIEGVLDEEQEKLREQRRQQQRAERGDRDDEDNDEDE